MSPKNCAFSASSDRGAGRRREGKDREESYRKSGNLCFRGIVSGNYRGYNNLRQIIKGM